MSIVLQRIYEKDEPISGNRILVDRVWPRGISKENAHLDQWMKDIAPSPSLRKWFNHDPDKFDEFKQAYKDEIQQNDEKLSLLKELKKKSDGERLILLYGAKDQQHNHAVVLKEMLESS
ncbi:DUF488 domain-containing protein [Halobacillus sp. Marseille-Q1614]|uniref:DUF488 domain-containing protein n=1 Tax=Halobacillus sp. Marseille-Q1614 TaxID=2709134 RepID=UPI00157062A6|nr:DUF488 family protein [Halobacillus sp. Marseille-Q1614]